MLNALVIEIEGKEGIFSIEKKVHIYPEYTQDMGKAIDEIIGTGVKDALTSLMKKDGRPRVDIYWQDMQYKAQSEGAARYIVEWGSELVTRRWDGKKYCFDITEQKRYTRKNRKHGYEEQDNPAIIKAITEDMKKTAKSILEAQPHRDYMYADK